MRSDEAATALAARTGKLDVFIHCAGRLLRHDEHNPEIFMVIVKIHLGGNMCLASAFRPHLAATIGCIINIGSMYPYFGASMIPGYAAAKTAVVGLTKSLALPYVEDGIRVNAIAPGRIRTEVSRIFREDPPFNEEVLARLPTHRWPEPDELVGPAVLLASTATKPVNGVTIPVDGGYVAT